MKLYKEAERLYLKENLSIDEIAVQLDISRRTIFYWKKKYEWDRKRFEAERNQEIFSEELLEFARKLMQKISKDMDNKTPTPQSEIYSLMKILKNIPQVKQYENSNPKSKQPKPTRQLTPEVIEQIEREVLGI
jgi:transposase-like protein